MAKGEVVTKVWIEPGCIVCDACETTAPDVFQVQEDTCLVRPEALHPEFTKARTRSIMDAAEECPVDVIKYQVVAEEVAAVPAPAVPSKAAAVPGAKAPRAVPQAAGAAASSAERAAKPASREPAAARAAATAAALPGVEPDPAIAALLRAATSRGGGAVIARKQEAEPQLVAAWQRKNPRDLPPEARQAKVQEAARQVKQDPDQQRRAFMSSAALAAGWGVFAAGSGIAAGPAFLRFMMPNVLEEPDPRIRVGKLQRYRELAPGEVIEDYKPQGIWMIREGVRLAALNIICTHLGCIPNWLPNDRKFKCPCHGSGYKPNGVNFEGPTPRPLERFRIYVEDGMVVVDRSKKYQYELGQWELPGSFLEV